MKKFLIALLTAVLVASSYVGVTTAQSSSSIPAPGLMPRGTAALPGMSFAGDRDTGLYWPSADKVGISVAGTSAAVFSSTSVRLNLDGGAVDLVANINSNHASGPYSRWQRSGVAIGDIGSGQNVVSGGGVDNFGINTRGTNALVFGTNSLERARIAGDGTFLINKTADSAFQLDVNGSIAHNGTQAYWFKGYQTYTSGSGTYTVPAGVRAIRVRGVGGGGGGGYARALTTAGARAGAAGGNGGHCFEVWLTGLSASYSYAVGAAGAGGVAATTTNGTAGGNTTFSTFTANGGSPGNNAAPTTNILEVRPPNAGTAKSANVGAHLNTIGGFPVLAHMVDNDTIFTNSHGGTSCASGQGAYTTSTSGTATAGAAADGPGGGGGGATAWRAGANVEANGAPGAAGIIVIEEYF